ncbi:MAG TPA: hypothetical protein VHB79_34525 [Polyangiaceae bacterium]|nr:hypothetical protein [Polyangiaceae bacterium]
MKTGAGWLILVAVACRAEPGLSGRSEYDADTPAEAGATVERNGAAAGSMGGKPFVSAGSADGIESAGAAGTDGAPASGDCSAQSVTLAEIHAGRVRSGVKVEVEGLVASSQKFLVSEAKSGSCLWGAFAADARQVGANSGLFLVSFGAPHAEDEACQSGGDGLPDDLAPGDLLRVSGKLDEYAPSACSNVAAAQQLLIDATCPLVHDGAQAPPEAAVLDTALADRLAAGQDVELLRQWGGALVRLEGVSAQRDEDGDAVFPFGVVRLTETSLEVHSRLYYFDLSEGGPRAAGKSPHYAYPTTFGALTGVVFLDYCSWSLAPRDRCRDLVPASSGCPG